MQTYKTSRQNTASNGNFLFKTILFFGLITLAVNGKSMAQQTSNSEKTITINMNASENLPADLVIFNININAEADTPQAAFEIHKKRESVLANLLKEFDIKEEDIDYEPIRMNKQYQNDDKSKTTITNQSVSVTFSDFSIYEEIQVSLIENDFDSFNGNFSSSKLSEGKDKALIKAINSAREKAELIANTSGVNLGDIKNINYSDYQVHYPRQSAMLEYKSSNDASMMDFGQTVSISANINVSFLIE